jgi:hypothetical protein
MVLASARLRGIHNPDNIQNGGHPGGECLSNMHWLGPRRQHFDDESWRGSGYSSQPSDFCVPYSVPTRSYRSVYSAKV